MVLIMIPIVVGLTIWANIKMFRLLVLRSASRYWIGAYFVNLTIGVSLGFFFASFSYFPHPTLEVVSFPVPSMFFVLEKYENGTSAWVDFVTPAPFLFAISNVPIFVFLAVAPLWLYHTIRRMFKKRPPQENKVSF